MRLPILADFGAIEAFVAIMETRSISKAAARLNTVPSAISQKLSVLEARADRKFFNRTTRSIAPTEAAYLLYNRCKEIVKSIEVAEQEIWGAEAELSGELRVAAPVYFGMESIAPILPDFKKAHPNLRVTILLSATEKDLISEGFDLAIRMQGEEELRKNDRKIMNNPRVFCASPSYLEEKGIPKSPDELHAFDCLIAHSNVPFVHWPYRSGNENKSVRVSPILSSDNVKVLIEAALQGLGIALLGRRAVHQWLDTGQLVTVLDDYTPPPKILVATAPDSHYLPRKASAFVDFLIERLTQGEP